LELAIVERTGTERPTRQATQIVVSEGRPLRKGESLQGFLTLRLPSGLTLHDCTLHERANGARWIGLPARSYTQRDGTPAWARLVDFASKVAQARFQRLAKDAVDKYFAAHPDEGTSDKVARPARNAAMTRVAECWLQTGASDVDPRK
jgi:hypothetical protein